MATLFISHSAKSPFARAVRDAVYAELKSLGHDVLLDKAIERPGQRWRPKICHWLERCDGAIILLSSDALRSEWVRAETTILCWRQARDPNLRLVPVVFPGISMKDKEFDRYRPFHFAGSPPPASIPRSIRSRKNTTGRLPP